jgi:hypothetical protein
MCHLVSSSRLFAHAEAGLAQTVDQRLRKGDRFIFRWARPPENKSVLFSHPPSFRPHFSNGNVADSIAQDPIDQARKRKVG